MFKKFWGKRKEMMILEQRFNKLILQDTINDALAILEGEEKEMLLKLLKGTNLQKVLNFIEDKLPGLLKNKENETKNNFDFLDQEIEKHLKVLREAKNREEK